MNDFEGPKPEFKPIQPPAEKAEIPIWNRNFSRGAKLGSGVTGEVYEVKDWDGNTYAAKIVDLFKAQSALKVTKRELLDILDNEAAILNQLNGCNHPALPKFLGKNLTSSEYYLVMEYIKGENLREKREKSKNNNPYSLEEIDKIILNIGGALATLHTLQIKGKADEALVYLDLKPANIVCTNDSDRPYILLDYGMAISTTYNPHITKEVFDDTGDFKKAKKQKHLTRRFDIFGTAPYTDPVYTVNRRPDPRVDVYEFAATILDLSLPKGIPEDEVSRWPATDLIQYVDKTKLPPETRNLLKCSLSLDMGKRPKDMREFLNFYKSKENPNSNFTIFQDGTIRVNLEFINVFPKKIQDLFQQLTDEYNNDINSPKTEKMTPEIFAIDLIASSDDILEDREMMKEYSIDSIKKFGVLINNFCHNFAPDFSLQKHKYISKSDREKQKRSELEKIKNMALTPETIKHLHLQEFYDTLGLDFNLENMINNQNIDLLNFDQLQEAQRQGFELSLIMPNIDRDALIRKIQIYLGSICCNQDEIIYEADAKKDLDNTQASKSPLPLKSYQIIFQSKQEFFAGVYPKTPLRYQEIVNQFNKTNSHLHLKGLNLPEYLLQLAYIAFQRQSELIKQNSNLTKEEYKDQLKRLMSKTGTWLLDEQVLDDNGDLIICCYSVYLPYCRGGIVAVFSDDPRIKDDYCECRLAVVPKTPKFQ